MPVVCSILAPPLAFAFPQGLRIKMIKRLYGEHYHIWTLRVEPADVGHAGVNRERLYLILSHRERTEQICCPLQLYSGIKDFIIRRVKTRPCDYFVSSPSEVCRVAVDLADTRRKKFNVVSRQNLDETICSFMGKI